MPRAEPLRVLRSNLERIQGFSYTISTSNRSMKTSDHERSGAFRTRSLRQSTRTDPTIQGDRQVGRILGNAVLTIVPAISLPTGGGKHHLIAHLATSNERDGRGCRDHPWAVNVVHNVLDFLADHLHTNDRV